MNNSNEEPQNITGRNPPEPGVAISQKDAEVFAILLPSTKRSSKFDNISAMIAYAQYALQKHQFIEQYKKENNSNPSDEHLISIIISFKDQNSAALNSLKEQAKKLLREYAEEYADSIQERDILEPINKIVQKHTNVWYSIGTNLAASFLYSLLIAAAVFIALATAPDSKFAKIITILLQDNP